MWTLSTHINKKKINGCYLSALIVGLKAPFAHFKEEIKRSVSQ